MGFFKSLGDKAKAKIDEVKSNVSKQDLLDLVTDCQHIMSEGKNDNLTKMKVAGKLVSGLGQMATGKYKGGSRELENAYRDPSDVAMADETKDELNQMLVEKLKPRQFIYADQETTIKMGIDILNCMNFMGLCQDKTLLPRIRQHLDNNQVKYDAGALDSVINRFIRDKVVMMILEARHQVDKDIFIDRKTKDEILNSLMHTIQEIEKRKNIF